MIIVQVILVHISKGICQNSFENSSQSKQVKVVLVAGATLSWYLLAARIRDGSCQLVSSVWKCISQPCKIQGSQLRIYLGMQTQIDCIKNEQHFKESSACSVKPNKEYTREKYFDDQKCICFYSIMTGIRNKDKP